jgi:uroporphyrinogen decarboxylase
MNHAERFKAACRREKTDCTPVWFMRQAGRYMPEYRRIREKHDLLEMFKTPEIAVEVTLQPVRAFEVDAAIIFADILLPLEGMGVRIEFAQGEGPIIHTPVHTLDDARDLRIAHPQEHLGYVLQSLRAVKAELGGTRALIGFAGAPFTLASYMIEGGGTRDFLRTKCLMYEEPEAWDTIMSRLCETLREYLLAQYQAGADVVQLFDSWAGALSPADYREFVLPYTRNIFEFLRDHAVPSIHFATGTSGLLPLLRQAGGDVIGVDWRIDLEEAWGKTGHDAGIQGNLDPVLLMAPWPLLSRRARLVLDAAAGRPGHIFNLGHGVLQHTPVDSVKALADFVHEYRAEQ